MIPPEKEEWNGLVFLIFFTFYIYVFSQLNYYVDKHKEKKYSEDVNYDLKYNFRDKFIVFHFDNSSEKIKARRQQYYF